MNPTLARRAAGAFRALLLATTFATIISASPSSAHESGSMGMDAQPPMPMGHAAGHGAVPAGVMGAHMVGAGELMLSYTPMMMHMQGNLMGTTEVSPAFIATLPNRFSPPHAPTYRVVPTAMDMNMHMFGAMMGLSKDFNLMLMATHVRKDMDMITFAGRAGTTVLGTSSAATEGLGDGAIVGLVRLHDDGMHHLHANLGLSLPIGSTTEKVTMLSPMGTKMTMRASYGMQLGSGTFDALPGLTYTGKAGSLSWGLAYRGRLPLSEGEEGWRFGDLHEATGWLGYSVIKGVSLTGRVAATTQSSIRGIDPKISGAMQALDPDNYGGERVLLLGGVEMMGKPFGLGATRLAIEGGAPVYERLNGPQASQDWLLTVSLGARF